MSDVQSILTRARRLGLRVCVEGNRIAIAPARLCPPDLLAAFRQHKPELLSCLEGRAARLREDEIPWLHIARQILAGEWEGADGSARERLAIGLRSIRHPDCQRALERLEVHKATG